MSDHQRHGNGGRTRIRSPSLRAVGAQGGGGSPDGDRTGRGPAGAVHGPYDADAAVGFAVRRVLGEEIRRALREELGQFSAGLHTSAPAAVEQQYLSVKKAAALVGVSEAAVRKWQRVGLLPRYHAGRKPLVGRADLLAFLRRSSDDGSSARSIEEQAEAILARR